MSKKQTAPEAKLAALHSFSNLLAEEPTKERTKKRKLSKAKMQSDAVVGAAFNRYGKAVPSFNAAKLELMESKIALQRLLALPLSEGKKIKDRYLWDCGIDDKGNFWYKDDIKSFEERYKDFKRQIGSEEAFDDNDLFFEGTRPNVPSPQPNTSADMSGGSAEGTPENVPVADFLDALVLDYKALGVASWPQKKALYFGIPKDKRSEFIHKLQADKKESKWLLELGDKQEEEYRQSMSGN